MPVEIDTEALELIKQANERDAAIKAGKEPPKAEAKIEEPKDDDHSPKLSRSQIRQQNRLREDAAEERGRRLALEELMAKGVKPTEAAITETKKADEDPKPIRQGFASDAEFHEALGAWSGRQEVAKILSKRDAEQGENKKLDAIKTEWMDMDKKAVEDVKQLKEAIPDYEATMQAAADDPDAPTFKVEEHETLMGLFLSSPQRALMYYHLAKEPDDLKHLLSLTPTPIEQITEFKALERYIKRVYATKKAEAKKEEPSAAERDAKKRGLRSQ